MRNYLNELQNPPVTNKDNSEGISKVFRLPWIPIFGPKLRKVLTKKTLKPFLRQADIQNLKIALKENETTLEREKKRL